MEEQEETQRNEQPLDDGLGAKWKLWNRKRYIVAVLAFFGFFNVYALRVNLSIAVVAMTRPVGTVVNNVNVTIPAEFDWNSKETGLLLSSFFYGYICTQIFGGWLSTKYGGSYVFGIGIGMTALLTLVTPVMAKWNFYAVLILRVVEGLFEGVTYPCIHALWAKWAPPLERSRLATIAFSGSYIGTVIALPACGVIATKIGWQYIFYIFGCIGIVWYFLWVSIVPNSPQDDKRISTVELNFIENSLGPNNGKKIIHPWNQFFKSLPVWAIIVAHFCENWGFYTLLTQLPTYMKDTLQYEVDTAGFFSGLPYLVMAVMLQYSGYLADYLRSTETLSTTAVRAIFTCTAFLFQTVFMMVAGNSSTSGVIFACLVLAVGVGGLAWSGFAVNHLDIAPQHASVLMGLSNTFATLPGMISPLLTGYIVQNKSADEWKIVFYIASSIYLGGAIFYGIFSSGELQSWAKETEDKEEEEKKNDETYDNKGFEMSTENL